MGWVFLVVAAAFLMTRNDNGGGSSGQPVGNAGSQELVEVATSMGITGDWLLWLLWTAKGESGWSINAWNKSQGERNAAAKAYDRLVEQGRWKCPKTPVVYGIGSGGWFGQLAPYTAMFGQELGFGCDPLAIWRNPRQCILTHMRQVRGTLKILRDKTDGAGTFLQLRALYGLPSRNPATVDTPERRAGYTKTLNKAGIDPALLDRVVPDFPKGLPL